MTHTSYTMRKRYRKNKHKAHIPFKRIISSCLIICFFIILFAIANGAQGELSSLRIEDGMLQPCIDYSHPRDPYYTNDGSDIQRFCVYVETDYDTDGDGMADLVKAFIQVPTNAVKGGYKAASIYDPTPYNAGTVEECVDGADSLYIEKRFDYSKLYEPGQKRTPTGEMDTMEAAAEAIPEEDWNYRVPVSNEIGYMFSSLYDYYLLRGYAIVQACGIGTYGSEGFELCGTDLERDSHKCVVEWLNGKRTAFTNPTDNITITADWSNGNVAMTGCSYGGTIPYEVATTGVEGLKTIIPYAGIASWYDYTNSQGIPIIFDVNYKDYLSAYNCGGTFLDDDWLVPNDEYGSWLWSIAQDEDITNGDYAPVWAESDYSDDYEKINCSALIIQGLNDFNVTPRQADLMYRAFSKAGQPVKMIFHQDGHNYLTNYHINGEPWLEIQNKWLAHYLYDIDNGIENMPAVMAQSNLDGSFQSYDSWREFTYEKAALSVSSSISEEENDGEDENTSDKAVEANSTGTDERNKTADAGQNKATDAAQNGTTDTELNEATDAAQNGTADTKLNKTAETELNEATDTELNGTTDSTSTDLIGEKLVTSNGLGQYTIDFMEKHQETFSHENMEDFYMNLSNENAAFYDIKVPDNTTIYGVPELHVSLKTPITKIDGLMISAILIDVKDDGDRFPAFMLKDRLGECVPNRTIGEIYTADDYSPLDLLEHVQNTTTAKCFSFGWTDLRNPGLGEKSSEYANHTKLEKNKYYDYTFYMLPTVYTVAPGHHIKLVLTTWDPYRTFLDETFNMNINQRNDLDDYDYSFTIDQSSIQINLPVNRTNENTKE